MSNDLSWIGDLLNGYKQVLVAGQPLTPRDTIDLASGFEVVDDATKEKTIVTAAGTTPLFAPALRALVPLALRQTVQVDGYAATGDRGGGVFDWNSTDTRADDGGTVFAVTGIATGRWNRRFYGAYDPRWFGAVGDSTATHFSTDNSTALQNCIAAAALAGNEIVGVKGGRVLIPASYFGFATTLNVLDHVAIEGVMSRYVGPGVGGQFGSVLAYFGTSVAMAMTTVTTGADIRGVTLANFILTSNQDGVSNLLSGTVTVTNGSAAITFSTAQTLPNLQPLVFSDDPQTVYYLSGSVSGTSGTLTKNYGGAGGSGKTTALPTIGLHIAGNGGGPAVSDCKIERFTSAEFDIGVQWGDGDSSQADSISWFKCNTAYCITYGWWINSANAADSTWMHDCHCLGNYPTNVGVSNCIGMYIESAGNLVLDSCQGDALKTWVKFTGGNVITFTNCETENCDYFLDSNSSSGCPIVLDHNTINSGLRFAGNVRIVAHGNMLTCIDHRGNAIGINLNGSGVHWVGHGNPNQSFDALPIFGTGTWDEQSSGTFAGLYDQSCHAQGEMVARPAAQYGAGATTEVFAEWELCTRSGIRGAPWTASTVTAGGHYVVQNPQGAEVFVCVAITSDQETGGSQPSFNTGTTTIGPLSDALGLPQSTIHVTDTSAFPSSGTIGIRVFAGAGVWDWGSESACIPARRPRFTFTGWHEAAAARGPCSLATLSA